MGTGPMGMLIGDVTDIRAANVAARAIPLVLG
jgi:hypothetical protein